MLEARRFVFFPAHLPLPPTTDYKVVLRDVKICANGGLARPDTIAFTTERYGVSSVEPANGSLGVYYYDRSVTLTFNIEMDTLSVRENFSLTEANTGAASGTFSWDTDLRKCTFTQSQHYRRQGVYKIMLSGQARDHIGRMLGEDLVSYFTVQ